MIEIFLLYKLSLSYIL